MAGKGKKKRKTRDRKKSGSDRTVPIEAVYSGDKGLPPLTEAPNEKYWILRITNTVPLGQTGSYESKFDSLRQAVDGLTNKHLRHLMSCKAPNKPIYVHHFYLKQLDSWAKWGKKLCAKATVGYTDTELESSRYELLRIVRLPGIVPAKNDTVTIVTQTVLTKDRPGYENRVVADSLTDMGSFRVAFGASVLDFVHIFKVGDTSKDVLGDKTKYSAGKPDEVEWKVI